MGRVNVKAKAIIPAQLVVLLLLYTAPTTAQARLAVLEFFGRPTGAYCQAAGPAMITLQDELQGRAILLEYHFDEYRRGRVERFSRAAPNAPYLPLVMVGSGAGTSHGPVEYESEYRALLGNELARPPQAAITAYQRRLGDSIRIYVTAQLLGDDPLADDPSIWAILWEDAGIGVSNTWVRSTVRAPVETPLAHGERILAVLDSPQLSQIDWGRLRALVLLEHINDSSDCYDMLQAAVAEPADLQLSTGRLQLTPERPTVEISLSGPHVLGWTATPNVPWLEVVPDNGLLPAEVTVRLHGKSQPRSAATASIRFDASGDGMSFTKVVAGTFAGSTRRVGRRVAPATGR